MRMCLHTINSSSIEAIERAARNQHSGASRAFVYRLTDAFDRRGGYFAAARTRWEPRRCGANNSRRRPCSAGVVCCLLETLAAPRLNSVAQMPSRHRTTVDRTRGCTRHTCVGLGVVWRNKTGSAASTACSCSRRMAATFAARQPVAGDCCPPVQLWVVPSDYSRSGCGLQRSCQERDPSRRCGPACGDGASVQTTAALGDNGRCDRDKVRISSSLSTKTPIGILRGRRNCPRCTMVSNVA